MAGKYNPFRPDKIAPPGMFAGRGEELLFIEHCLLQAKNGNPQHFILEGERGIGKSSLLLIELLVATGELEAINDEKLRFITVEVALQATDDFYDIINKIASKLKSEVEKRDALKAFASRALDIISQIEVAGVSISETAEIDKSQLLSRLQDDFVTVIKSLGPEDDGVLLLLDEADKPSAMQKM